MEGNNLESNDMEKICSFCGEVINPFQKRCPYCGSLLTKMTEKDTLGAEIKETCSNNVEETITEKGDDLVFGNSHEEGHSDRELLGLDDSLESNDTNLPNPVVIDTDSDNAVHHMGNKMKVFLATIFAIIPGIGQIAGLITAIIFMNSRSGDKKSYGKALFTACIIVFILTTMFYFLLGTIFLYAVRRY